MAPPSQGQQKNGRKGKDKQTAPDGETSGSSGPTKNGEPAQPSKKVNVFQLHTLSEALVDLKRKLPGLDDKMLYDMAEAQLDSHETSLEEGGYTSEFEEKLASEALCKITSMEVHLNKKNWWEWIEELRRYTRHIRLADELLFGKDEPVWTPYLRKLDRSLAYSICWPIDKQGPLGVRFHHMAADLWWSGRLLIKLLEPKLQPTGDWERICTFRLLNNVTLVNDDIEQAIKDIERLARRASDLGAPVTDAQKCAILLNLTMEHPKYKCLWTDLRDAKGCEDWKLVTRTFTMDLILGLANAKPAPRRGAGGQQS